jgi:hypothetical protein
MNMTPKEKAIELVNKFNNIIPRECDGLENITSEFCALIAVDEIMKAPHQNSYIELIPEEAETTDWFWDKFDEYWNEVKQEIELL